MNKLYPVVVASMLHMPFAIANEVPPVVVTASRTAQTVDETLAAVTVITRQDIERKQAQSIQEVLRGVPGVTLSNNGGAGKTTSIFLRGTESDHVLVLIDGIKVGSATLGTTAFQQIPIALIERIEIVRGPRSSLYGSEALGGVIQIFTRKGGGTWRPFLQVAGGSYQTYHTTAGLSGGGDKGWLQLTANAIDTDGFNACTGKPFPNGGGCFTTEPDKDGYQDVAAALRAGYRINEDLEIDAQLLRSNGETDFDGSFVNQSETVQQVLGGTLRYAPAPWWQLSFTAGASWDEADNFKDGTFRSRFDTQREHISWQNDLLFADQHLVTFGIDYQHDEVDSDTSFTQSSRDNTGIFTQYQSTFAAHDLQLSLRSDDNEQFGNTTTGGFAWGYTFANQTRFTAAYGTAFKAPSFNELYFPGFGNAQLAPEHLRSIEVGLGAPVANGHWSVNAYHLQVDDLIAFDAASSAPANVNEARILGLEAQLTTHWRAWRLHTNFTLLKPENRNADTNNGNTLARRAKRSFMFEADRQFGQYALGTTVFAQGKRFDDLANSRTLGGYATLDLRGEYSISSDFTLQLRIENLFDKDYESAAFFNQPGRSFLLTLRYQP